MSSENKEKFIIAYDLPSENQLAYSFEDKKLEKSVRQRIRNSRILSTYRLHSLGLQTTQSVILSAKSKEEIQNVLNEVYEIYKELNNYLKTNNLVQIGEPLIKVIPITPKQFDDFKTIAEKQLLKRLDNLIDKLAEKLSELHLIVDEEKRRKALGNLRTQKSNLNKMQSLAEELEINLEDKFELLSSMIDKAINILMG